jgi:hypothetical protein
MGYQPWRTFIPVSLRLAIHGWPGPCRKRKLLTTLVNHVSLLAGKFAG